MPLLKEGGKLVDLHMFDEEPDLTSPPHPIQLSGEARLACTSGEVLVVLTANMVPGRSVTFKCQRELGLLPGDGIDMLGYAVQADTKFTAQGMLGERDFYCESLSCVHSSFRFAEYDGHMWRGGFIPQSPILLDRNTWPDKPVKSAVFALMTYLGDGLDIEVDGWHYHVDAPRHYRLLQEQAQAWRLPIESTFSAVKPDRPTALDKLRKQVDAFLLILSLSEGEDISYNRCCICDVNDDQAEIWYGFRRVADPVLSRRMPLAQRSDFVSVALSNYSKMPQEGQGLLRLAIRYHLDAKQHRVLQSAFISEAIAWEMLVRNVENNQPLAKEVEDLKDRLTYVLKEWKKRWPEFQDHQKIFDRVYRSLKWMPLREGIEQLISGLGLTALPEDPQLLREFRDSIMHSGRMPRGREDNLENSRILKGLLYIGDLIFARILYPNVEISRGPTE